MGDADRNWLHAVLTGVGEAVLLADPEDRITAFNPAAETLTGWKGADAVGRRIDEVLPGLAGTVQGGDRRPLRYRDRAGRERLLTAGSADVSAGGGFAGRVFTLREASPGATADDEDRLERFARKISHDLRSPIHAVVMMAELLVEDAGPLLPQDQQVLLHRIIERVRGLDGQVSELLHTAAQELSRRP